MIISEGRVAHDPCPVAFERLTFIPLHRNEVADESIHALALDTVGWTLAARAVRTGLDVDGVWMGVDILEQRFFHECNPPSLAWLQR
jgi:hypothetical protein